MNFTVKHTVLTQPDLFGARSMKKKKKNKDLWRTKASVQSERASRQEIQLVPETQLSAPSQLSGNLRPI